MNSPHRSSSWIDVDALIAQRHPDDVLAMTQTCIVPKRTESHYRMACPIDDCESETSGYGNLSIELEVPYRIQCFTCGVQGNLLDLFFILQHGRRPSGDKLRGQEFKDACQALQRAEITRETRQAIHVGTAPESRDTEPPNVPLAESPNERTRQLVHLLDKTTVEPAEMTPQASHYFRMRPYLTAEQCAKWGIGYLPKNRRSTLQGRIVYRIDDLKGRALAFAGRDPEFESKPNDDKAIKMRFPSADYFRKGQEWYGQQTHRLEEPGYRQHIAECGLTIVEGCNDTVALDHAQFPSLAAMSNQVTDTQLDILEQFRLATNAPGAVVMFDRDAAGEAGAKEAICRLSQRMPVINGWAGSATQATEPEQLTANDIEELRARLARLWRNEA